jgi:hypothetical protein
VRKTGKRERERRKSSRKRYPEQGGDMPTDDHSVAGRSGKDAVTIQD